MLASLLTALLFSISAITAHRTATRMGGVEANFWRICVALVFLTIWANTAGSGLAGPAFPIFALSGLVGIGVGDTGFFQALPRLGSQRTTLLTQCATAPAAALIEWLWLGTALTAVQGLCVVVILAGVVVALAPGDHLKIPRPRLVTGILFSLVGALGMAFGAVLSRKAYAVAHAAGQHLDPGTAGYQRVLGGAVALGLVMLVVKWQTARMRYQSREARDACRERSPQPMRKEGNIWPWVIANSLAGQTLGVTCMQWALETTPTGIVTAIIAMTPIVMLPLACVFEGDRITARSVVGGMISVAGVIGLALAR